MLARTGHHPCDIHRVARSCDVTLHDGAENRTSGRESGHCYCKPTVHSIGRQHGEGHLAICLRLINETGNGRELHAAKLRAVSALVLSGWVTVGSDLFDAFDGIDLGRVRGFAKTMPGTTADTMAALLLGLMFGQRIARKAA
jgi:hypothetical protein